MLPEREGDMNGASIAPRSIVCVSLQVAGFKSKCHRGGDSLSETQLRERTPGAGGDQPSQQLRYDLGH